MCLSKLYLTPVKGKKIDLANMYAYCLGRRVIDQLMFNELSDALDQDDSHILEHSLSSKYYSLFEMKVDDDTIYYLGEISDKIFQGEIEVRAANDKSSEIESRGGAKIAVSKNSAYSEFNGKWWPIARAINKKYLLGRHNPFIPLKNPKTGVEVLFRLSELN